MEELAGAELFDVVCATPQRRFDEATARLGWKYLEAFENRCAFARAAAASAPRRPLPGRPLRQTIRPPLELTHACASRGARSQKYKEGKFIVEKSRIVEGEAL